MSDPNPYEPPREHGAAPEASKPPPVDPPSNLPTIIATALFGGILGIIFLSPFLRGPGDPTGRTLGFALGALAGLTISILSLVVARRRND